MNQSVGIPHSFKMMTLSLAAVPMVARGQLHPPPSSGQLEEDSVTSSGVLGSGDPAASSYPPSQAPPTPPPRPQVHGRSMSVDLKQGKLIV